MPNIALHQTAAGAPKERPLVNANRYAGMAKQAT
jgi:hypothetical protein